VFHMRQSPLCNEHYACACYSNEIIRLRARLNGGRGGTEEAQTHRARAAAGRMF
jgi:hypothetical protein